VIVVSSLERTLGIAVREAIFCENVLLCLVYNNCDDLAVFVSDGDSQRPPDALVFDSNLTQSALWSGMNPQLGQPLCFVVL